MSGKKERTNAFLISLYFFQFSLLIPLMQFFNSSILVAIGGILIIAALFLNNGRLAYDVKKSGILWVIALFMVIKYFIDGTSLLVPLKFLAIAIPPFIVLGYKVDWECFIKYCKSLAKVNAVLLAGIPFFASFEYMRFGYGMLLSVIFAFLDWRTNDNLLKKTIAFLVFVVAFIEMVLFGARGALVCFVIFLLLYWMAIQKSTIKSCLLFAGVIIISLSLDRIIDVLYNIAGFLGYKRTYALMKFQKLLTSGLEASSSGRFDLYRQAISDIFNSPLWGVKMETSNSGTLYVHNLFLQVGSDFGLIAMAIIIIFFVTSLACIFKSCYTVQFRLALAFAFCISCGRLLLSSTLWERPEFWAFVYMFLQRKQYMVDGDSLEGEKEYG